MSFLRGTFYNVFKLSNIASRSHLYIKLTCHIKMGIAGGLAQLIGYDTLVNSSVGMTNTTDHQAVNISDYRRDNIENKHFIFLLFPPLTLSFPQGLPSGTARQAVRELNYIIN